LTDEAISDELGWSGLRVANESITSNIPGSISPTSSKNSLIVTMVTRQDSPVTASTTTGEYSSCVVAKTDLPDHDLLVANNMPTVVLPEAGGPVSS